MLHPSLNCFHLLTTVLLQPNQNSDTFSAVADSIVEKPSPVELREIYQQLRPIPCTPAFRLNQEIQRVVVKFWGNVPGAIAYLKEALRTWERVKSPEAVFVAACINGKKPESWGKKPKTTYPQPSDEHQRLLAAKARREIVDYYQQPDGLWVVDTGKATLAWWEVGEL